MDRDHNPTRIAASLIVAHPDDEIIFAGQLLLSTPDVNWTIHSLCGSMKDDRGSHFMSAMKMLADRGVNLSATILGCLPDSSSVPDEDGDWYYKALRQIDDYHSDAAVVFTHNRNGDYGHPLHCATNYAVHAVHDNVFEFVCGAKSGIGPSWLGPRIFSVDDHGEAKRDILLYAYGDEVEAISRDRPRLFSCMMQGAEVFTSAGTLPW